MMRAKKELFKIVPLVCAAAVVLGSLAGCASKNAANVQEAETQKRIVDILTGEDDQNTIVTVRGNQPLTYTAVKQEFPLGVLFHFPDTALEDIKTVHYPPENETIDSIRATELQEDGRTSRLFIALKQDVPYDISPESNDLNISFPKAEAAAELDLGETPPEDASEPTPAAAAPVPVKPATRLEKVSATPLTRHLVVRIEADGTIKDYQSFTIDSPPRIVFDLNRLESPFDGEQRIDLESKWASAVRHCGHPGKVRLVIDTNKTYVSKYSATAVDTGLLIHVGDAVADAGKSSVPASEPAVSSTPASGASLSEATENASSDTVTPAATTAGGDRPAWVNRIEFSGEEEGKSSLIVGTTRPVQYELQEAADRRLHLILADTNLPEYRKRALITTRFESAVDRVTPVQSAAMQNESLFVIEMREKVPYFVEQTGNTLRVNFAASKIPPKPYEAAELPAWKKAAAEAPESGAAPLASEADAPRRTSPAVGTLTAETKEGSEIVPYGLRPEDTYDMDRQQVIEQYSGQRRELDLYRDEVVKKYTGEKISLDFYETDIKNVFRIIREVSGQNLAIDKDVTGRVTLTLAKPVPWDQALDLILKMNGLGRVYEGDIIRIATQVTLAREEKQRQDKLKEERWRKKQEPHVTAFIPINYADASEINTKHVVPLLTKQIGGDDDQMGKSTVDARLNMIVITDTPTVVKRAKEIISKIDRVTPQVVIEARVVEANTNFTREIGFDWGEVTLSAFNITDDLEFGPTVFQANNIPDNFVDNNSIDFSFQTLTGTSFSVINAKIQANEVDGKVNIISAPKIVTLNNREATIKQGFEVPYLERDSSGNATVRFKDVDLLLKVTPAVTNDGRITMKIYVTKNDLVDPTAPEPALSTNEAETEVLVEDGDTIVIGGILKDSQSWAESGIPGLRKVPAFGWLFKSESTNTDKNELLIFITPRIIQLEQHTNV
jgi:type IV pilus assembly protein PilQ